MQGMDHAELVSARAKLSELAAAALELARAVPMRPQGERCVWHVIDASPVGWPVMWAHAKLLVVAAVYKSRYERLILLNPGWTAQQKWEPLGCAYELNDASREPHDRSVRLSESEALLVLCGIDPPAAPPPEPDPDVRNVFERPRAAPRVWNA